jgi:oligoendopeptidase F
MYAAEAQPTMLQDYTIFVAEIASTFNEHALLDYFLNSEDATKEEKIMVIEKAIDSIMATFYRQTLFAEYELIAHDMCEKGQPINHEVLSQIMIDLYKKYYDIDIEQEAVKKYVWAYIPHLFYTPFYVYQYATSFAASFKLYKDVKEQVPGAFDRYIGLLSSGGSKYPMDQAKEAGIDFTQKETFMAVVERMDYLLEVLEKLVK